MILAAADATFSAELFPAPHFPIWEVLHTLAIVLMVRAAFAFGPISGLRSPTTAMLDKVTRVSSHATACIVALALFSLLLIALGMSTYGAAARSADAAVALTNSARAKR
jgi:hypothetical protein